VVRATLTNMKRQIWLLVAALMGVGAITAEAQDYFRTIPINPGDILFVRVWRHPNLNTRIEVKSDGTITLPLIGDLRAEGLDLDQFQARCEAGYAALFPTQTHVGVVFVNFPKKD